MGRLTKDAWAKPSLRTKEIEVEVLGGSVLIRELPAAVSADLKGLVDVSQVGEEQRAKIDVGLKELREFLYGVVTDDLEPMFIEDEVKEIQTKHGAAFVAVVDAIEELSGLTGTEEAKKADDRFPGSGVESNHAGQEGARLAVGDSRPDNKAPTGA